ncbi:hypothetical protein BD311DRAFT_745045 [Dichomitus squalens]|uniref:Uncharacterized protein n=1 Tax=Dichomitus squalens TaxID=114155 RepID=A0A4Q9N4B8_9APHY|nr:hypothetical protein BD311DRAFT_745045 [Dichomitus squalens]
MSRVALGARRPGTDAYGVPVEVFHRDTMHEAIEIRLPEEAPTVCAHSLTGIRRVTGRLSCGISTRHCRNTDSSYTASSRQRGSSTAFLTPVVVPFDLHLTFRHHLPTLDTNVSHVAFQVVGVVQGLLNL